MCSNRVARYCYDSSAHGDCGNYLCIAQLSVVLYKIILDYLLCHSADVFPELLSGFCTGCGTPVMIFFARLLTKSPLNSGCGFVVFIDL